MTHLLATRPGVTCGSPSCCGSDLRMQKVLRLSVPDKVQRYSFGGFVSEIDQTSSCAEASISASITDAPEGLDIAMQRATSVHMQSAYATSTRRIQ